MKVHQNSFLSMLNMWWINGEIPTKFKNTSKKMCQKESFTTSKLEYLLNSYAYMFTELRFSDLFRHSEEEHPHIFTFPKDLLLKLSYHKWLWCKLTACLHICKKVGNVMYVTKKLVSRLTAVNKQPRANNYFIHFNHWNWRVWGPIPHMNEKRIIVEIDDS